MSGKSFKVLLIEGDTSETSLVKRYLADGAGSSEILEVKEAVRVSSACHALARETFDVVIFDLQVPQNVGLEGFVRIRAQRPEIPVILLIDLKDEALAVQALKLGAQDYLVKGTMDCCLLKRAIRYAIEKKNLANLVESLLNKDASAKLVVDAEAAVLYVNPAAEALFGVPAAELAGKPFSYPREAGAVTIVSPKAAELAVEMSVSAIEWNGEPARLISFMGADAREPDAPDRRRLDEVKDMFARRLSHEMRNTISTVKTAVYCLKDPASGPLSVRQERFVDMISRNVDRQIRLFDKLGDLARFKGGRLALDIRRLELTGLIDEIARESEFKSAPSLLELELELEGRLPPIAGDADLLLQVLRGLLDNAFRHAKAKVTLSAAAEPDGGVRVTVADDGDGIPAARIPGLFTPFAQLDPAQDASGFKGGLGLTISREIIASHGGRIWAESGGAGARVNFTLPAYDATERERAKNKIFVSNSRSRPIYAAAGTAAKDRP